MSVEKYPTIKPLSPISIWCEAPLAILSMESTLSDCVSEKIVYGSDQERLV